MDKSPRRFPRLWPKSELSCRIVCTRTPDDGARLVNRVLFEDTVLVGQFRLA
jgi:hypothetical protein